MNKTARARLIFWSLFGVIVAGLGVLIARQFELVEETINQGWSFEARRNPFLAAERFLQQREVTVTSSHRLASLDQLPADGLVIITNSRLVQSTSHLERLFEWLENGGQLLLGAAASSVDKDDDGLLNRLELSLYSTTIDCGDCATTDRAHHETGSDKDNTQSDDDSDWREQLNQAWQTPLEQRAQHEAQTPDEQLTRVGFVDSAWDNRIEFDRTRALWHPGLQDPPDTAPRYSLRYWTGNDEGVHALQLDVGQGTVTALSDMQAWTNRRIHYFDHALGLAQFVDPTTRVHFLYGAQVPGIAARLRSHFPETLTLLAAGLVLWLWAQIPQFGPRRQYPSQHRRALSEHLRAAAHFVWRSNNPHLLLEAARTSFWHRAYRRLPGFKALTREQQVEALSQLTGRRAQTLEPLLFQSPDVLTHGDFTHYIQTLQALRKSL